MYALTRTPLGRMCNAVRDNPERVRVRRLQPADGALHRVLHCRASSPASPAALAAINFEIVNASYVGAVQSGTVLFCDLSSAASASSSARSIGAIFVTCPALVLSDCTESGSSISGLMFIAVVLFAPGGIAGLIMMHRAALARRHLVARMLPAYLLGARAGAGHAAPASCLLGRDDRSTCTVKASDGSAHDVLRRAASTRRAAYVPGSSPSCSSAAASWLFAHDLAGRRPRLGRAASAAARRQGTCRMTALALELRESAKSFGRIADHPRRQPQRGRTASATPSSARTAPASPRCSI